MAISVMLPDWQEKLISGGRNYIGEETLLMHGIQLIPVCRIGLFIFLNLDVTDGIAIRASRLRISRQNTCFLNGMN